MKILALDTCTELCSAALLVDGARRERSEFAPRGHAQLILPMIESLLAEAGLRPVDLDGVAFGRGPGSFTGVRIGAGVTQGIAFAADLPVVPVSTLAALAQGVMETVAVSRVAAAIDARMDEVYWGAYRRGSAGLAELEGAEVVLSPDVVCLPDGGDWHGVGSGWDNFSARLNDALGRELPWTAQLFPRAGGVAVLGAARFESGEGVAAECAVPVYLRDKVAWQRG